MNQPWTTFSISELLLGLGEDLDREGLQDTPKRVQKAWHEMLQGYTMEADTILATTFQSEGSGLQVCHHITFVSMCEHHLLPFLGNVSIAYCPKERVVGLSKLARLVDCFSKRLQIQERMVQQILDSLVEHLEPENALVVATAKHLCCAGRGVRRINMDFTTSARYGSVDNNIYNLLIAGGSKQ